MRVPPLVYNLFPRIAGTYDKWLPHAERAAEMGFNWLYLNPVFFPGFSGSIYAVKDFRRLDPTIVPPGTEGRLEDLLPTLARIRRAGLQPMVDLVINHTARDADLVTEHPEWYRRDAQGRVESPWAIDPADARRRTVWGDLAELDFDGTADPGGLLRYVLDVVRRCLDVGFAGFRCDAAYKIPPGVWSLLISEARRLRPGALFVAETLGCRPAETLALKGVGFDYVMNSSKYWAFDAPWCLEQHEQWQVVAPSISFPESHDTTRLAAETGGLAQVQKQRLAFAAFFSEGLLVPVGYEHGFRTKLDVVRTTAATWEPHLFDLRAFVRDTLALKLRRPALSAEGRARAATPLDRPTLVLEKTTGDDAALILINKDWRAAQTVELGGALDALGGGSARLVRPCEDGAPEERLGASSVHLGPAEVAVVFAG